MGSGAVRSLYIKVVLLALINPMMTSYYARELRPDNEAEAMYGGPHSSPTINAYK
jgi:hypothetical protein